MGFGTCLDASTAFAKAILLPHWSLEPAAETLLTLHSGCFYGPFVQGSLVQGSKLLGGAMTLR